MERNNIFNNLKPADFEKIALDIFKFQAKNNLVYNEFLRHLNVDYNTVNNLSKIPFLPIQFFKSHKIVSNNNPITHTFLSSGTTSSNQSKHFITDIRYYEDSFEKGFEYFYGPVKNYTVLAFLPAYLERKGSSLVYMVNQFIKKSKKSKSGFYLDNIEELYQNLLDLEQKNEKVLLIGVSFALLDLSEKYSFNLTNTIVMETGGMKGRRKELIRKELHDLLCKGFGVQKIHSEYGMTELLSQAYSKGNGIFECPPWMQVLARDPEDALTMLPFGKSGGLNIIDLANVNSCSFIATQDLGRVYPNGTFEVLGRFDNSDIRGCNLMVL